MTHEPTLDRIPVSLRSLDWQPMDTEREWSDGQQLLVAGPVRSGLGNEWYYELSIVRIECGEDWFRVTEADEAWGWDLDDVDYYVEVRP